MTMLPGSRGIGVAVSHSLTPANVAFTRITIVAPGPHQRPVTAGCVRAALAHLHGSPDVSVG